MRKIDHCQSNDPVNWSALQSDSPACLATSELRADWPVSLLRDFASLCRKHQFTDRYLVLHSFGSDSREQSADSTQVPAHLFCRSILLSAAHAILCLP